MIIDTQGSFCACCVCEASRCTASLSVPLPPAAWHFLCFLSPAITAVVNAYSWQPFSPSPFYFSPLLFLSLSFPPLSDHRCWHLAPLYQFDSVQLIYKVPNNNRIISRYFTYKCEVRTSRGRHRKTQPTPLDQDTRRQNQWAATCLKWLSWVESGCRRNMIFFSSWLEDFREFGYPLISLLHLLVSLCSITLSLVTVSPPFMKIHSI